ncbi:hypothetical protein CEXT_243641 [Caerostris extrusa]|uniref:Uncharacterized protein n=1 Tax=Caerostris extrusa TaxID=172846 RepID=A0AAV4RUL7_CAEEX|nr:hypothetical protein CEXT_243641 [Caerostris extrusa]
MITIIFEAQEIEAWMDQALWVVDDGLTNLFALIANLNERTQSVSVSSFFFQISLSCLRFLYGSQHPNGFRACSDGGYDRTENFRKFSETLHFLELLRRSCRCRHLALLRHQGARCQWKPRDRGDQQQHGEGGKGEGILREKVVTAHANSSHQQPGFL